MLEFAIANSLAFLDFAKQNRQERLAKNLLNFFEILR